MAAASYKGYRIFAFEGYELGRGSWKRGRQHIVVCVRGAIVAGQLAEAPYHAAEQLSSTYLQDRVIALSMALDKVGDHTVTDRGTTMQQAAQVSTLHQYIRGPSVAREPIG